LGFAYRWIDDVELTLKNMGVNRWRTGALDRTEWASVMREATQKNEINNNNNNNNNKFR